MARCGSRRCRRKYVPPGIEALDCRSFQAQEVPRHRCVRGVNASSHSMRNDAPSWHRLLRRGLARSVSRPLNGIRLGRSPKRFLFIGGSPVDRIRSAAQENDDIYLERLQAISQRHRMRRRPCKLLQATRRGLRRPLFAVTPSSRFSAAFRIAFSIAARADASATVAIPASARRSSTEEVCSRGPLQSWASISSSSISLSREPHRPMLRPGSCNVLPRNRQNIGKRRCPGCSL